ncbi:hypothetical protein ACQ4LE_001523 [Meloidogyne hapla]|uniref:Nucleosome assembly protein 1-like 1 n=1 Tax=Meloidogyne hapla TaxID=6305 RepID=A0A1I8B893_MELHA
MNNKNRNLMDLLKANDYDVVDNEESSFAPHLSEMSRPVIKRVRALKKLQLESLQIETEFYQKVYDLEKQFQPLFDAVNEKRRAIVVGEHEPADDEADIPLLHGVTQETLEKIENEAPVEGGEPSKGIPGFWYNVLNSVGQISDMIKEYDQPILQFLVDITSESLDNTSGFTLSFHFDKNPYFTDSVLQKHYQLQIGLTDDDPFDYDGPTVVKSKGCEINWNAGKDVTQKIIKTKQKKGPNVGKFITKTVRNESFFNFFENAERTLDNDDLENEEEEKIREDFELGQIIRDQVVTRAVLFFTGEASEDDIMDDYDDEEDDEDDDGAENNGVNSDSDLSDGDHETIRVKN